MCSMVRPPVEPAGHDGIDAPQASLYRRILGDAYEHLPPLVRDMHEVRDRHTARGRGRVTRGSNLASRLLADVLGMPPEAADIPVETTFALEGGAETITRNYNSAFLITRQAMAQSRSHGGSSLLQERFGPVALFIALEGTEEGITFHLERVSLLGIRLPSVFSPGVIARERVKDGLYHYFVRIELPLIGMLVEYEGLLKLD